MPEPSQSTPLMRQYHAAKRQYPEALLLFRLGDFYELFFDDAVTAARELDITLTARNKEKGAAIPMCGVPFHAAEGYIARLIQKGYKVALCDQMESPRQAKTPGKALVRREITRVLTPGTAPYGASSGENTYLAALARAPRRAAGPEAAAAAIGLALLDVSTGEFRATQFEGPDAATRLSEELARWRPREILYAAPQAPLFASLEEGCPPELAAATGATLTPLEAWVLEPEYAQGVLESHFGVLSLEGFGLVSGSLAATAAGAIVHYVKQTQRSPLAHVDRLGYFERQQDLVLDAVSVRNLELIDPLFQGEATATLRSAMDATVTAMGKRLLRQWMLRPSGDATEIEARHGAVAALVENWDARQRLRSTAAEVQDLERLLARVALETAQPRDLSALARSLDRVPEMQAILQPAEAVAADCGLAPRLASLAAALDPLDSLRQAIAAQLVESPPATMAEGGFIRPGIDHELDELRDISHGAKGAIARIEARERERTSIGSLKVRFNNVFGYYLEVSKANLKHVPADYERKQTLVNAERFTTPELKELERKILSADEQSVAIEQRLFAVLRQQAIDAAGAVRGNAAAIAELDVLANFAHLAAEHGYIRPQMGGDVLDIRDGRHPVVERLSAIGGSGAADRFVPNDVFLDREQQRLLLVTGPNMGGKSTYLRQTALIAILAQMGSFVPARAARLPIYDRIFTRIGASDNLARGRSTFMVEMTEAAVILNQASSRSLVILDEIGRGTATYDGLSLAWAMVEYLHAHNQCQALFATHYHELTELGHHLPAVRNVHVAAKETPEGIVFLRRIEAGEASRSYGIDVARLAGLPRPVITRAREVLHQHEAAERRADAALHALDGAAQGELEVETGATVTGESNVATDDGEPPAAAAVAARVAAADLNVLTPLEALNLLAELQRQVRFGWDETT